MTPNRTLIDEVAKAIDDSGDYCKCAAWANPCDECMDTLTQARAAIMAIAKDLMNQNMTGTEMVDYLIALCEGGTKEADDE